MNVTFDDDDLERLFTDPKFTMRLPSAVVRKYRQRMQEIIAATDERDVRALKSLHLERLKGKREGQLSIRLNDQYRLIFVLETEDPGKVVRVVGVEDYH